VYSLLALKNLKSRPARTILTASGIAIGVAALTLMISLSEGLKTAAFEGFSANSALTRLTVQEKPQSNMLSLFPINGRNRIDRAVMEKIGGFEHVKNVYPEMIFNSVSSLEVSWLGQGLQTDSMVFGVPYDYISDEYKGTRESWDDSAAPYPALISKKIMDIYNFTVAPASGLPAVSENDIQSVDVSIIPGQSTFFPQTSTPAAAVPTRIVGFSGKTSLVGITIPLNAVRKMNIVKDPAYEDRYIRLYIQVDKAENVEPVRGKIQTMGLDALSPVDEIKTISEDMLVIEIGLGMVGMIILIVAGLMIASTFLSATAERKHEIGLFRALGAAKSDIRKIFLSEAAFIGLGGGLIGIFVAIIAALATNRLILNAIPEISFKPDSLFSYNSLIFGLILVFSVGLSVVFAFIPASMAARLNPLEALTQE
jgi:ABC-type antimicrobial peptide transport system permease subunit